MKLTKQTYKKYADARAPKSPLVRDGARAFLVGGLICTLGQGLTDSVHASVSGRVIAIEARPHPWGGRVPAIVIQNDGQNTPWPHRPAPLEAKQVELELLLGRVREAGITDMGDGADATAVVLMSLDLTAAIALVWDALHTERKSEQ